VWNSPTGSKPASTEVLVKTDALIDKLVGDQVVGLYVPGIAGPARLASQAGPGEILVSEDTRSPTWIWKTVSPALST
jgi:hypothetical protein